MCNLKRIVTLLFKRGFKVGRIAYILGLPTKQVMYIIDTNSTTAMINKLIIQGREDEIMLPLSYNLRSLINRWDYDMKGDMMGEFIYAARQGIDLLENLDALVNNIFPIWIDEADQEGDKERKEVLEDFEIGFFREYINLKKELMEG